ncbi:hypothetical protein EN978_34125 [Mesorhizobium sp. M7A.F.Ca.US.001.04.1.1]|uniref:DUF7665 family protein n=1 Tax=unclassified Mesorhizobium TaxID=325217 RepID=UPI000FCBC57F|nr:MULTISPECIES: hypothetical protein [unclassified Mesorhizobium]RUY22839.1 hypothetical protein EN979_30810 [Mesorhizobium sp. M7A.F.Ca.US.001.04.2.1]RUY34723.1 hypothetical protein EN978_34125 [Mesorhizobium sp. M7A.F.Ca.US.001.04.1.1]
MLDPAEARVRADLEHPAIIAGVDEGRWLIHAFAFPRLDFVIAATEPDGKPSEYGFRGDLTNFPATSPMVRIWDLERDVALAVNNRPKGNQRIAITFQQWGDDTVYRPWDRMTGPHGNNANNLPHLAWRVDRRILFIFEDLHGILNLNARAHRLRAAA